MSASGHPSRRDHPVRCCELLMEGLCICMLQNGLNFRKGRTALTRWWSLVTGNYFALQKAYIRTNSTLQCCHQPAKRCLKVAHIVQLPHVQLISALSPNFLPFPPFLLSPGGPLAVPKMLGYRQITWQEPLSLDRIFIHLAKTASAACPPSCPSRKCMARRWHCSPVTQN